MDNLGIWSMLSVPLFFALTGHLKGRAQNIAVWIYLWTLSAVLAVLHWRNLHLYAAAGPDQTFVAQRHLLYSLWLYPALITFLLILPVVWYSRDPRNEHKPRPSRTP